MQTLTEKALAMRDRARALKSAPILTRMSEAAALADDLAEFVVKLAAAVDSLTPFIDEKDAGEGVPEPLCNVTENPAGGADHA